jgi:competence protein ComFC
MNSKILKKNILNFLFPIDCAGCGREDAWLCEDCLSTLPLGRNEKCIFCGSESPLGRTCAACAASHSLDGVFVCADYENKIISTLIKKLKYSFARELGDVLGEIAVRFLKKSILEEKISKAPFTDWQVLPVPLHKKRLNWRGFNQAEIIATYFAGQFGLEISQELARSKYKKPQARLSGLERQENIKDCFAWIGADLNKKNILLIDDVATTGSTLNEAGKTLKRAGAGKVFGLVIAKG